MTDMHSKAILIGIEIQKKKSMNSLQTFMKTFLQMQSKYIPYMHLMAFFTNLVSFESHDEYVLTKKLVKITIL